MEEVEDDSVGGLEEPVGVAAPDAFGGDDWTTFGGRRRRLPWVNGEWESELERARARGDERTRERERGDANDFDAIASGSLFSTGRPMRPKGSFGPREERKRIRSITLNRTPGHEGSVQVRTEPTHSHP